MIRTWRVLATALALAALAAPLGARAQTPPALDRALKAVLGSDTSSAPADTAHAAGTVLWAELDDVIGSISARYLTDAIEAANDREVEALVIQLDTPGGLDTAMRQIIKAILASEVPVAVYVAPEGARAASAGVYIAYSAHVAAMAPGTNLGAATPVNMGGQMDSTMAHKVTNDAAAYIEGLADLRGRNAAWAVRAVREAVSLPSDDAVTEGVVDFIATGPRDLLRKMDGRTVKVQGDSARVIRCAEAEIVDYPRSLRYRILGILNNPNVAYLLLILGFYGLFFEFSNPGSIFPGVMGGDQPHPGTLRPAEPGHQLRRALADRARGGAVLHGDASDKPRSPGHRRHDRVTGGFGASHRRSAAVPACLAQGHRAGRAGHRRFLRLRVDDGDCAPNIARW